MVARGVPRPRRLSRAFGRRTIVTDARRRWHDVKSGGGGGAAIAVAQRRVGPLALRAGLRNAPWLQLNFVAKTAANSLLPMLAALFSGGGGDLVHYVEAKTVEYGIGICRTRFGRSDAECNLRF